MSLLPSSSLPVRRPRRRPLYVGRAASGGRNHHGRITAFHRGGGHKRRRRWVNQTHGLDRRTSLARRRVVAFEYDPQRSARLARLSSGSGRELVLATRGRTVGSVVLSDRTRTRAAVDLVPGSSVRLGAVAAHTQVHSLELQPGRGAQRVRGGGTSATVVNQQSPWVRVRLPSGEHRLFPEDSRCTLGAVLGQSHWWTAGSSKAGGIARPWEGWRPTRPEGAGTLRWPKGKAGRTRWLGRRPTVRGTARNPIDHPHGGGQGKTSGGRPSVSPWSVPKGVRTSSQVGQRYVVVSRRAA